MKNVLKLTMAAFAVLSAATTASAQDSANVDVVANIVADETPISITATSIADMGTLTIPNGNGQTCVYNIVDASTTGVTDETGVAGSNPDANVCRFTNIPDPITYDIGCSFGRTVNITVASTQDANALASGINFLGHIAVNGSDFLYSNTPSGSFPSPCDLAQTISNNLAYAVSVPATAQPYSGSIGSFAIEVSY